LSSRASTTDAVARDGERERESRDLGVALMEAEIRDNVGNSLRIPIGLE
jgi:hypothetical protein